MKQIFIFLCCVLLFSCKKEQNVIEKSSDKTSEIIAPIANNSVCISSWVGNFEASKYDDKQDFVYTNKITLLIKKIEANKIYGQSIVAGNVRPFEGFFDEKADYQYVLKEPGDNKYDGIFYFSIINNEILGGIWEANDKTLAVTERKFKLKIKHFVYDASLLMPKNIDYTDRYNSKRKEVIYNEEIDDETGKMVVDKEMEDVYRQASNVILTLNASTTKLTEKDLKNLKKLDLEIIRNTIFARHGYSFKKKAYRQFFDPVDWYVPVSDDVAKELTPLENENIAILKKFEQYAIDNYDSFGR